MPLAHHSSRFFSLMVFLFLHFPSASLLKVDLKWFLHLSAHSKTGTSLPPLALKKHNPSDFLPNVTLDCNILEIFTRIINTPASECFFWWRWTDSVWIGMPLMYVYHHLLLSQRATFKLRGRSFCGAIKDTEAHTRQRNRFLCIVGFLDVSKWNCIHEAPPGSEETLCLHDWNHHTCVLTTLSEANSDSSPVSRLRALELVVIKQHGDVGTRQIPFFLFICFF